MTKTTLHVLALWSFAVCCGQAQESEPAQPAAKPSAQVESESPEIAALRAGSEAFVAAFNKADAKAIAAMWTAGGEYIDEAGQRLVGRDAIAQAYGEFFAAHPGAKIQVTMDALRQVGPNAAIEDGRSQVEIPSASPTAGSRYTVFHVQVDGQWLMASVRDTAIAAPAAASSADLAWLVGTWEAEEHGVKTESIVSWVVDGRFLQRAYTTTRPDGSTSKGLQLIGWNPLERHVQSWDFSPDGGYAVGTWAVQPDGWTAQVHGTTGGGLPTSSVNLLHRLDDNAYVWQSVQRSVAGHMLGDTDEIVCKRQSASH